MLIMFEVWHIMIREVCLGFTFEEVFMNYLSIRQTSEKWNISPRRINVLCSEGRIDGAIKIGSYWAIPDSANKPTDARIKSGKYRKGL